MEKFISQAWPMQILIEKFLRSDHILKSKLNADDRIFMVILASYMGNKNECWPGYEAIINDSGIASKSTINKSGIKLETLKILSVERKHRNNNRYKFTKSFLNSCVQICTRVLQICTQQSTDMYSNNNINNIKNNPVAAHSEKPNQKQAQSMASVTSQSTSSENITQKRQGKGSPLFEEYIKK